MESKQPERHVRCVDAAAGDQPIDLGELAGAQLALEE
jgi:hypothetical protein